MGVPCNNDRRANIKAEDLVDLPIEAGLFIAKGLRPILKPVVGAKLCIQYPLFWYK